MLFIRTYAMYLSCIYNIPVTVMKISLPPSRCNTKISYSLSSPELSLYAVFLSTYTSSLISHFSPKYDKGEDVEKYIIEDMQM